MNMVQSALCLTRILSSGMECLCLVLVCWNVHRVHAQTRGLVADVHVCMMCNQSATDSFVIKAVATSRHNLWHNLWHVWSILHVVVLELLDVACQFATHATSEVVSSI